MDIEEAWVQALKQTEILRSRVSGLMTTSSTRVPYILLSESSINQGDTVVRRGEVLVEKPSLIVPPNNPQFLGFDFNNFTENDNSVINFLIVRGVSIPSLRYDNHTVSMDIFEGKLSSAIKHYTNILQKDENVHTGLIRGSEDAWPFSLLIFICHQIARNANVDIKRLLDDYHKNQ